jgi:hypothetical protein
MTKSHRVVRIGSLGFVFALATGALACEGETADEMSDETTGDGDGDPTGDGDGDPTGDGDGDGDGDPLSHAADIQPIWDDTCLTMCHAAGGTAVTILDLSGDAYDNIVGAPSTQVVGMNLVEPGDSANSYLVHKLRGTQVGAGGLGAAMPSGSPALPEATIAMIEAWIDAGAAP